MPQVAYALNPAIRRSRKMKTKGLAAIAGRGLVGLIVGGAVLLGQAGYVQPGEPTDSPPPVLDSPLSLLPCQQLRNEISADACAHFNVLLRQYQLSAAKAFNCIAMVQDM